VVTVYGVGMICGVGLNAPAACAAIRCGINHFRETRFMDNGGEWIMGCEVPLEQPWRGRTKLVKMLAMAIRECLANPEATVDPAKTPLLLCVAETGRPGRLAGLDDELFRELQDELRIEFHEKSGVTPQGRVAGAVALYRARKMIHEEKIPHVLIAGVDSLLVGPTLMAFEEKDHLLTRQNSNGFIPGEAAAAVLIGAPQAENEARLHCLGMGFSVEKATVDSENPFRADGLSTAIKGALTEANCTLGATDFRITDLSGEQYYFKEAALALSRTLRQRKEFYDIWHPADCIGEVGAAIGPVMLTVLRTAQGKDYAPGKNILCHSGGDNGKRAALILTYQPVRPS
jgi:3-oxoacyl-[acyl-carrier-protein] synthase-1